MIMEITYIGLCSNCRKKEDKKKLLDKIDTTRKNFEKKLAKLTSMNLKEPYKEQLTLGVW